MMFKNNNSRSLSERPLMKPFFFGNYFYGICVVALSIEASLQQRFPLNSLFYYLLLFVATVLYYTKAYTTSVAPQSHNRRMIWYYENKKNIFISSWILIAISIGCAFVLINAYWEGIKKIFYYEWLLALIFPVSAVLYYGISSNPVKKLNLRSIDWLKPFVIGFTWAGAVTIYPVLFYDIVHQLPYQATMVGSFLFLKNLMFVAVLCIMFDIKDYADDSNQGLKTFVTAFGLRKTIFYILIPLSVIGLGSFLTYGATHDFSMMKILLNTIPFILLVRVAYSLHHRKSIFYYLVIIDGLLLVKAVCGSIAMIYF